MPLIKKEEMTPGTILRVKPVIRDGLGGTMESLIIPAAPGQVMSGTQYHALPGELMRVLKKPRRTGDAGINCIRVQVMTVDLSESVWVGEAYWTYIRASCEIVP